MSIYIFFFISESNSTILELIYNSTQTTQSLCMKMERRIGVLETEILSLNAKLATLPQGQSQGTLQASPEVSTVETSDVLATLKSEIRDMETTSQKNLDAVLKVNKSLIDSLEKKVRSDINSLCKQTKSELANIQVSLSAVRARDVDLGSRVASLIKVSGCHR